MRFKTIGLIAIFIIALGTLGIYKSDALNKISTNEKELQDKKIEKITVSALAIKQDYGTGSLVPYDSFKTIKTQIDEADRYKYITESDKDSLISNVFFIKKSMKSGALIEKSNLQELNSGDFTDVVMRVDRSTVEEFKADFYDIYWHFNQSGRSKNNRKIKLFAKNVFIRTIGEVEEGEENTKPFDKEHEKLSPVVFSVQNRFIDRYLQADQLGYFKIVKSARKTINLENYSTLEVDYSKEIQANDISSSYKYDVNIIK
ncbi:hypothetical protein [Vibrio azureus]|uniref:hypothetical protein n=1 Tax=Vibrio azureus TaxID=512649 RepID=UPI0003A5C7DB|nr:hypothetical protein [Vibrio azureus]